METTINVPFKLLAQDSREHPGVPFCYIDHPCVDGSYYGPVNKSKQILRTRLNEQIEQGLRTVKNSAARAIGTGDGSVFVVRFVYNGWSYAITGSGRKFAGSTSGFKDIEDATEHARKHAADSFGGVAWECSL
jgi:hypothetical protein